MPQRRECPPKGKQSKKKETVLCDIVDFGQWQRIQDYISAISSVTIRTVDAGGNLLASPSGIARLCREVPDIIEKDKDYCKRSMPGFLGGSGDVDDNLSFECFPGLKIFVVPLKLHAQERVYILIGPFFLIRRWKKEEYISIAEKLAIDIELLWSYLLEIKVFSFKGVSTLKDFVRNIYEYILQLACNNLELEEKMLGRFNNEMWLSSMYSSKQLIKILDILLEVAFSTTNAEFGSIMLIDSQRKELFIKSSRGLPDSVVNSTRVKLGEGISGLAAQEKKPYYIDSHFNDERIVNRLHKPNLSASMVLPIILKDRTLGVMNLSTSQKSPQILNQDNFDTMSKLVDLAGIALGYIQV